MKPLKPEDYTCDLSHIDMRAPGMETAKWKGRVKLDVSRHVDGRKTYRVMHWGYQRWDNHHQDWQLTGFYKTYVGARWAIHRKLVEMKKQMRRKMKAFAKKSDFITVES